MNNFIYDIPTKVYFGQNQLHHLGSELIKYGTNVLLVYGTNSIKENGLYLKTIEQLTNANLNVYELSGILPNPRIESVRKGISLCKANNIEVVLAVGGGSVIDAAKFIAAGACVDFDAWKFFSENAPLVDALPLITILSVSATGSEMNNAGVITNLSTNDKLGRKATALLPKVSFLDPTNSFSVGAYQTACGSADIVSHLIEVYFNMEPDLFLLDSFMESMIKTVIKYAPIAISNPTNYEARANLMWSSSLAINGLIVGGKNSRWSCHPMEHALSAFYDITHGLGLAILTPHWLEYCLDDSTVSRYVQFGTNVFNIDPNLDSMIIASQSIKLLAQFFSSTLNLPNSLSAINIDDSNFSIMANKACKGSIISGFKPLDEQAVIDIYMACL
ncbi:MAG: iron-containing alcohol dehydrogenase [Erysipelotrichaceae bacterium]